MTTRLVARMRSRWPTLSAISAVLVAASLLAPTVLAVWLTDSGTVDVQVQNKNSSVVDATTAQGAFISYFGDSDNSFGSSGTGVFVPFVRLQGTPTEEGFNTDAAVTLDAKTGTWTHSIKVSQIPQRPCPQTSPTLLCFELFVDINESNSAKFVSLNKVDVWFTNDAALTGYPFTASATTTEQYLFNGDILIHDVNQGSGRGDLRYDIPINGAHPITLPPNCDYGNPACATYFVLYSKWGTTSATYNSEGGFEEWKVKVYPVPPKISTTVVPSGPIAIGATAHDTATITATADAGGTITYALYSNNACTGLVADLTPTTNTVVNGIAPNSKDYTFNSAGTFYFYAVYSGDANNPGPVNSGCAAEPIVVNPNGPAPHSTPVVQVKDTFTVTGFAAPAAGAPKVLVGLFTSSDCTTGQLGSNAEFTVPGAGGTLTGETTFVGVLAGTYYFKISYAGDANNTGFTSCAESVGVTITSLP